MKKRRLLIGLMSSALLMGGLVPWRVAEPPPAEAASTEIITCIGFQGSLTIKEASDARFAVVYVHNFGFSTAEYTVRFADFGNSTLSTQPGSTPPKQTDVFWFGDLDQAPPNTFATTTAVIAQVISESKKLLVDAEAVHGSPLFDSPHRRHVGCGSTPQFQRPPSSPFPFPRK